MRPNEKGKRHWTSPQKPIATKNLIILLLEIISSEFKIYELTKAGKHVKKSLFSLIIHNYYT